jgi:uncharacterized protein YndB with AHSA1/START domain
MLTDTTDQGVQTIDIRKESQIAAPVEVVFQAVLEELGPGSVMPDGKPFPMKIEAWPGGRWFRDLGEGIGHLWGHVQVIKPPALLEISGPMFMSYPAINFVQYRLSADGSGTRLTLTHRAMGLIPQEHREGVTEGWEHGLKRITELALRRAGSRSQGAPR